MKPISSLSDLPVYTQKGTFVGHVKNAIMDLDQCRVDALILTRTNARIVERGHDVAVPYRWVSSVDDILVLHHFPQKVKGPKAEPEVAPQPA